MIDKPIQFAYNKSIEAVRYAAEPDETRFDFLDMIIETVRYRDYTR